MLRKEGEQKRTAETPNSLENIEITAVERLLCEFPEVVERAAREYAPHHICTYVFALGQAFNTYYATNQIIQAGELTGYRLLLTQAVAQVMKNSLTLLGIQTPETM